MAETTTDESNMSRTEVASFLRTIADEMDGGSGVVGIPVGNKEIRLSPPDSIDTETTITERSRRLRKDTEEVSLTFRWNPTGDTAESEPEPEDEHDRERETEPETSP